MKNKVQMFVGLIWVAFVRAPLGQFMSKLFNKVASVPKHFRSPQEITTYTRLGQEWRKDRGLMKDRYIHAGVTAHRLANGFGNRDSFDCDDHALFTACAMWKAEMTQDIWLGLVRYRYLDNSGTGAHAVVVYRRGSQLYWIDYNDPHSFSENEWASQVAAKYVAHPISWALMPVRKVRDDDTVKFGFPTKRI